MQPPLPPSVSACQGHWVHNYTQIVQHESSSFFTIFRLKGRLAENRDIVSLCQPTLSPHSTTHLFTNYPQLPFPSLTLSLPKSTPIPNLNPLSLPYHYLPPIVKANSSYIPGTMPRIMEQIIFILPGTSLKTGPHLHHLSYLNLKLYTWFHPHQCLNYYNPSL